MEASITKSVCYMLRIFDISTTWPYLRLCDLSFWKMKVIEKTQRVFFKKSYTFGYCGQKAVQSSSAYFSALSMFSLLMWTSRNQQMINTGGSQFRLMENWGRAEEQHKSRILWLFLSPNSTVWKSYTLVLFYMVFGYKYSLMGFFYVRNE